jgi:hypothetical protein
MNLALAYIEENLAAELDVKQVKGPEILWNEDNDITSPTFHSEIWIPVSKR